MKRTLVRLSNTETTVQKIKFTVTTLPLILVLLLCGVTAAVMVITMVIW